MNRSTAIAAAVSLIAASNGVPRKVACLCTYCLEDIDPAGEVPTHLAPNSSECEICMDPIRWRMGGFVFAILPAGV